jgi:hypothetical protein
LGLPQLFEELRLQSYFLAVCSKGNVFYPAITASVINPIKSSPSGKRGSEELNTEFLETLIP